MESVKEINNLLKDYFGIDLTGTPIWRVVWSEDQLEKRWTSYSDNGIQLIHPEVREYPKYSQWINEKYLLERLTIINSFKEEGMPVQDIAYEPVWVFEDKFGNALPPKFAVCKFVIETLYAATGKQSLAKYKDELANESDEEREMRLKKLQDELFGNETNVGDALAYREGIVVPNNYSN